jgi:hypothetical protein
VVRPRRFLPALVRRTGPVTAGLAVGLPLSLGLVGAPAQATASPVGVPSSPAAAAPAPDTAPLRVRIASLSKATLPARGNITIRGTVTNRSDETWTTINLYTFVGDGLDPMSSSAELADAMDVPFEAQVGERVLEGDRGLVETLEPGETAPYVVTVPTSAFDFTGVAERNDGDTAGVYWFGVHALGQSASTPRDDFTDGRARTFLPFVPRRTDPVPATLVVPLVRGVLYDADGSLADEDGWERVLRPGGRLRDLVDLADPADEAGVPLTWLVDPALLDAIGRLAAGNAPRSLEPTRARDADPAAEAVPSDATTTDPVPGATSSGDDESEQPAPSGDEDAAEVTPAVRAARSWLAAAEDAFTGAEVLTLPYGNLDVGAALSASPALLDLARSQQSAVLEALGIDGRPTLASPDGYVDPAEVGAAKPGDALLVSDRYLQAPAPAVVRLDGHELVVTSDGATQGSPGPGRSLTAVGLRQRLLAEAAVRARPVREAGSPLSPAGQPLTVVLPTEWDLGTADEFFDGIEPSWISFTGLSSATSSASTGVISAADLVEPEATKRRLQPETFAAVRSLIDTGDTLQRVLVDNSTVGARVTEEALSAISYSLRGRQKVARTALSLARGWLDARLSGIEIIASSGVTLSGDSGTFVVTLRNTLDERVAVSIAAVTDQGLVVDPVEALELGPQSRTSVLLNATTTTSRVHNVTLMVTDVDGAPIGAGDQLPIRSVLVSDVIWVIIGVGVGTLFLAIALRLRRRILRSRRA